MHNTLLQSYRRKGDLTKLLWSKVFKTNNSLCLLRPRTSAVHIVFDNRNRRKGFILATVIKHNIILLARQLTGTT